MKYKALIPGILAVGVIVLLAVLLTFAGNTVLYDAQKTAFSDNNKDPSVIGVMTTEESATILPLMEELLAQTNGVVIEIDSKDFEYSEKELNTYGSLLSRLKTNSGKLKLSNTDINDFVQSSSNMQISMSILNENIKKIEDLKQTASENLGNQELLNSIAREVLLLSKEIQLTASTYEGSSKTMTDIASLYNLDTSQALAALEYVKKIAADTETTSGGGGTGGSVSANLVVVPSVVKYGDIMTISGNLKNSNFETIGIYVDSNLWKDISAKGKTAFSEKYTIGKLTTGSHFVSLLLGSQFSGQEYFTVESSPTVLTINNTKQSDGENARLLTVIGRLSTDTEKFVSNATVNLYSIETGYLASGVTDSKGIWNASAELEDGVYNIYAEFSDPSFPLESSVSEVYEVYVSSPVFYYLIIAAAVAVFAFFIFRFVKGANKRKLREQNLRKANEESLKSAAMRAAEKLRRPAARKKISAGEMLVKIYKKTVKIIAGAEEIENPETKTPREVLKMTVKHPDKVKLFTEKYEYLHYSETKVTVEDIENMNTLSLEIIEAYNEQNK
ncbi:MAG: hypothetical protein Q4Q53_08845 [Methanocorpusculum sp.]|nr:hypothetical protein [Methanocorpusculum sp.]